MGNAPSVPPNDGGGQHHHHHHHHGNIPGQRPGAGAGGYIPSQGNAAAGGMPPYPPTYGGQAEYRTQYHPRQQQQQQQQQQHQYHPHHHMQQQHMSKSSSDTSMTMMDSDQSGGAGGRSVMGGGSSSAETNAALDTLLDDDTVPTVFRWEHGGRQVYITGTFNGWSRQIPMHRSGNDFTYIHNLKRGKHAFKFIVDDEWRFAPDQPTVADIEGRMNNFIDVTDFKAYTGDKDFEKERAAADYSSGGTAGAAAPAGGGGGPNTSSANVSGTAISSMVDGGGGGAGGGGEAGADSVLEEDDNLGLAKGGPRPDKDGEVYSHNMPDVDDYTKEPPPLPPHLRHIILNKPPQLQDTAALPVPQHVALNHLYCTAIRDNMMVLGITQRYKTKFVTTVYYSPCASK